MTPSSIPSIRRRFPYLNAFLVALTVLLGTAFNGFSTPPELLEARWKTLGEDMTYLDIYPLFGRDARTTVYVQVDLRSDAPISASQIDIYLENPILLPDTFDSRAFERIIKGNGGNATVQAILNVNNDINWPAYTPGTTISIKMSARDTEGAEMIYDIGEIQLYGPKDILPDVSPPSLAEAVINNGDPIILPEDFEDFSFEFSGTARALDDGKGVTNVGLFYRSEEGGFLGFQVDRFDLSSGSVNDGVFSGTSTVGKYIIPGTYTLSTFSVNDKAGNRFFGRDDDAPPGVQKTVIVINPNYDAIPPELVGPVIITPLTGDVTTEPAEFLFTFTAKDVGSGINFGTIRVFHSTDPDTRQRSAFFSSFNVTSGDEFMGTYEVVITIPPSQTNGEYYLPGEYFFQLTLNDESGSSATWGNPFPEFETELLPLPEGSTEMFTLINNTPPPVPPDPDLTPPVLESIVVECDHDFATGPGEMIVTLVVSEDMPPDPESTFINAFNLFEITSPTGATEASKSFSFFDLIEGTNLSGTYQFSLMLDKAIEPGPYCISVRLENESGTEANYGLNYDNLPFPNDFPGIWTIVNSGPVDSSPPVPVEFSVTPGVATEGTPVTLNVSMRITDPGTGLQDASLTVKSGASVNNQFRQQIFSTFTNFLPPDVEGGVGEGTKFDGTYNFAIELTGSEFSGDFLSFSLNLNDCAGNFRSYDTSLCSFSGSYPLPYHLAQVVIIPVIDENDYFDYANGQNSPFPFTAGFFERDLDFDFDFDGRTNGEEWAVGTDPTKPDDFFWAMVGYTAEGGTKVLFGPYLPGKNEYTLSSVFQGENRNESVSLNITHQVYEGDPNVGCFVIPPNQGSLENIQLVVEALKTAL